MNLSELLKKILPILLLTLVVFDMTGVFILFKIKQSNIIQIIEKQIEEGVADEDLHFFRLSQNEYQQLEWTRVDKEFRLDDSMYDIVHSEKFQDSIQLQCVNDAEEAELFSRLDEVIQKSMGQKADDVNSPLHKVIKIFKVACITSDFDCQLTTYSYYTHSYSQPLKTFYFSPHIETLVPPPDSV